MALGMKFDETRSVGNAMFQGVTSNLDGAQSQCNNIASAMNGAWEEKSGNLYKEILEKLITEMSRITAGGDAVAKLIYAAADEFESNEKKQNVSGSGAFAAASSAGSSASAARTVAFGLKNSMDKAVAAANTLKKEPTHQVEQKLAKNILNMWNKK